MKTIKRVSTILNITFGLLMFGVLLLNAREFVWPNHVPYRFYYTPLLSSCTEGLYHYNAFYIMLAVLFGMVITGLAVKKLRVLLYLSGIALSVYTLIPAIVRPTIRCMGTHMHLFNNTMEISVVAIVIMVLLLVTSTALAIMQLFKANKTPE